MTERARDESREEKARDSLKVAEVRASGSQGWAAGCTG